MIQIKIGDDFLDMPEDARLTVELNNPLFAKASNANSILGSFSYPFVLDVTSKNRYLLDYADLLDGFNNYSTVENVQLYFCGTILFTGYLEVSKAGDKTFKCNFIFNPFIRIKGKKLPEVFSSDVRRVGQEITENSMLDHANQTALNPENHDYIFFPVYNPRFFEEGNNPPETPVLSDPLIWQKFQNLWHVGQQSFVESSFNQIAMPFVKTNFVLEKIFEYSNVALDNQWINDELDKMVIYNNYSIYESTGTFSTSISISNHLPNIGSAEYISQIARLFNLGVFPQYLNNDVSIVPFESFAFNEPKKDWTKKAIKGYNTNSGGQIFNEFCFEPCSSDQRDQGFYARNDLKIDELDYFELDSDIQIPGVKVIYNLYNNTYYLSGFIDPPPPGYDFYATTLGKGKPCKKLSFPGSSFSSKMQPTYMTRRPFEVAENISATFHCPEVWVKGNIIYSGSNSDTQNADVPITKIMMYRGMYEGNVAGDLYPHASTVVETADEVSTGEYSLQWLGEKGLFNTWFKKSFGKFDGRVVDKSFRLHLRDIKNFDFSDKIKMENRHYYIKKMRITLTNKGILPVQTELVSTL